MKKVTFILAFAALFGLTFLPSCDRVTNPYPPTIVLDLDTTLYPGNWADYLANEWPVFTSNTNTDRNILIEDFTGHKCIFCPAAADLAHQLQLANPGRVHVASIHAGVDGIGDFQSVDAEYTLNFTNPDGLYIGTWFGVNDGGFVGNPRGPVSRVTNGGVIFQSPGQWSSMTSTLLTENNLRVNMQSALNYYPSTKGAFLHVEVEKLDQTLTDLGIVAYVLEDSLVGDQKMSDNTHNHNYVHRDIHRKNLNNMPFGRQLTAADLNNGKYYVNYSFVVPDQLDGNYNAANMHVLIYVYDMATKEIYQVIKQYID
ncbi:MAG: Omp28-related outer membrane protein [Sphingomonadales bacterium]